MRKLYDILKESILDSDTEATTAVQSTAFTKSLVDNGIYYACEETKARFKSACENNIASFKNSVLSFFNDDVKVASEVVIDYKLAKDFLKKNNIKSIEAPFVTIYNIDEDFSVFGTISARYLRIVSDVHVKTIKNLKAVKGRNWDATIIKNSDLRLRNSRPDFCDSRIGLSDSINIIKVEGFDKIVFQNCDIDIQNLTVDGDGVDFKNCKGELASIMVYDPGLFDGDCGKELFKLFDPSYQYSHYVGANMKKERKTTSLRKILAFFGNKKYYCPDTNPFKVAGKLKEVCDVSGFKNFYALSYKDNNYNVDITPNKDKALSWQSIDKFNYTDNYHNTFPLEETTDGYYVVIFSTK